MTQMTLIYTDFFKLQEKKIRENPPYPRHPCSNHFFFQQ
jgi:hypothetical protein